MRRLIWLPVCITMLAACSDDVAEVQTKGQIADSELVDGVTVTIDGELGIVELPFEMPVPAAEEGALEEEMRRAVSLFIASEISGAAADLAAGVLVSGTPAEPGEFAWSLNEERDLAQLSFYNVSPGGLTLSVGQPYRAQLGVTRNDFVANLPTISFAITVTGE